MTNFTANTYEMKREIMNFCKKISRGVNSFLFKKLILCDIIILRVYIYEKNSFNY